MRNKKIKFSREQALNIIAYYDLSQLNLSSRENILIDVYSEDDKYENINDFESSEYNDAIKNYLIQTYNGVLNSYLESKLSILLNNVEIIIDTGKHKDLFPCPCCGYKTIEDKGTYDICRVCYWEDDGSDIEDNYSSTNQMTLEQAKINFSKIEVSNACHINSCEREGKIMFEHEPTFKS